MNDNDISIVISGNAMTGKSVIRAIIVNALVEYGLNAVPISESPMTASEFAELRQTVKSTELKEFMPKTNQRIFVSEQQTPLAPMKDRRPPIFNYPVAKEI